MAFFPVDRLQEIAERLRTNPRKDRLRKIKVAYCGNCETDRECVYLFFHDVPNEFVSTRICLTCGYAPGRNQGVQDKKLRQAVLEADNYECVYCGATERLAIDHIVPHARGGAKVFENLLTACQSCNSSRRTGRTHVLRFGRFRK
jgi:Zn ribbon nucleic-acid-binding protein